MDKIPKMSDWSTSNICRCAMFCLRCLFCQLRVSECELSKLCSRSRPHSRCTKLLDNLFRCYAVKISTCKQQQISFLNTRLRINNQKWDEKYQREGIWELETCLFRKGVKKHCKNHQFRQRKRFFNKKNFPFVESKIKSTIRLKNVTFRRYLIVWLDLFS